MYKKRLEKKRKFYRLNQYIIAPTMRVIDEKGKQIGILSRLEALRLAQEKEADLVEIAPKANPPVCKLIDFTKFRYLEKKRERKEKKGSKESGTKEIRVGPFIGEHDFNVRKDRAGEFLKAGNKVKFAVLFRGRQLSKINFGRELLKKFITELSDIAKVDRDPFLEGRSLFLILSPAKYGKSKNEKSSR